tara:strand:+ start:555 stop:956 length:402 start_codon:yes stop_codon:yes gene_type:complete
MSIKYIALIAAVTISAALPLQASAGDLTTNNRTDFDSTSIVNNGACSTILGEVGISRAHTDGNVAPDKKVKFACILNKHNCKADVYMTANCTGTKAATVYFDVDTGVKADKTIIHDNRFTIAGNGFDITIEQN